ncbi:MAG: hypothetical protein KDC48_13510, partial [Planctomycetes bacterium]|nr:hypothetical protein [Planctomycetota bacterium]
MKGSSTNLVSRLLLLAALASPAASQVVELDVQFDGDDAQSWARALMIDEEEAIPRLTAGGASALPMLRALLADERKGVQEGVALVCERIGAPALPMGPALLAQLRDAEIYTTRVQAARALAAIGDRRPEVVDALLEAVFAAESDEVFLRITRYGDHLRPFAAALQSLDAAATARVLKAIDANQAASTGHAARVL